MEPATVIDDEILALNAKEYAEFQENEAQAELGMSKEEFTAKYKSGELDPKDPIVDDLAAFLGLV